jgi:signal transduction histidine kinase
VSLIATVVTAIYGVAAVSGAAIGYLVWAHRDQPGAMPLLGLVAGAMWWSGALFLAGQADGVVASAWLQRSTYLGVAVIVACILLFALEYTGRADAMTPRRLGLLAIHPAAISAFVVLDPGGLFFGGIEAAPGSVTGVSFSFGPAFWIHALYSYCVIAVALVVLFQSMYRSRRLYRWQFVLLAVAILVTAAANYAYIAGPVPFDTAPLGILLAAGLVAVAITRYRLIHVVPAARQRVLDTMTDGVIVVDHADRIVEINPAAREMAAAVLADDAVVGRDVGELFADRPALEHLYAELTATRSQSRVETSLGDAYVDVTASPLGTAGDVRPADSTGDGAGNVDASGPLGSAVAGGGWLFLVRDVTEREERERALRQRNEQLDRFATVVSHDLRNPLGIAKGHVEIARDTGDVSRLEPVADALDRMESLIEEVLTIAREGADVTDPQPVRLGAVADAAWRSVDAGAASYRVVDDATVVADRPRLVRILENLFRNTVEHGSTSPGSQAHQDAVEHGSTSPASHARQDAVEDGSTSPASEAPQAAAEDGDSKDSPDTAAEDGEAPAGTDRVGGADASRASGPAGDETPTPSADMTDGVTVTLGATPEGFYVADDGVGVPPEDRERVFESGYSTDEEGIGTGLAVVEDLASAHGWTVSVTESAAGGARFEFSGVEPPDERAG